MLDWLKPFSIFCYLDNQQYTIAPHQSECIVAAGVQDSIEGNDLTTANRFLEQKRWTFGHLSYELKASLHRLPTGKKDLIGFPPFYFFVPQVVIEIKDQALTIHGNDPTGIFDEINEIEFTQQQATMWPIRSQPVLSREEYIKKIKTLQQHILRGDCYEINFCQEFFADNAVTMHSD